MSEKKGFFSRLKDGLTKTRDNFVAGIDNIFNGFSEIDDDFYEELEEVLIMADIGVNTTSKIRCAWMNMHMTMRMRLRLYC